MNMSKKDYKTYVKASAKPSPCLTNCIKAFSVGGAICVLGQCFFNLYMLVGISEEITKTLVPCTLIFLAGFLTVIGVFDDIARAAGAGTLVPITGFANAVVSPSLDMKAEGMIMGVGAKMFIIAGPVIVYGIVASVIYGVILAIF